MQILNISVMQRPSKSLTSWMYPLDNLETLQAQVNSFVLTLWEAPKVTEHVQVQSRPVNIMLADLVTYTSIDGGLEVIQANTVQPISIVLASTITYSTVQVDPEFINNTVRPVGLVLRDVLLRVHVPTDVVDTGISTFQLILGGD